MPMRASRAVSIVSQSYSDDSERSDMDSSSPRSCWQVCLRRRMERRVSVKGLRTVGSAMRAGPAWRNVSARLRLISVTVALYRGR